MFTVFTDGASRGNPGPGGWGSVIVSRGQATELGGAEKNTTNNRMELTAAVRALREVPTGEEATIYTDSSYVKDGITKWVLNWRRNNWKTQAKQDVLNKDLWLELIHEVEVRRVTWKYVGGHVGILGNERCDHIATAFADGREVKLYKGALAEYDLPQILDISFDELKVLAKKSGSARSKARAYSYISSVGGKVEVHRTWAECERRVKGVKGARFRKSLDAGEERAIVAEFGTPA
ncbi:MAG: ribonuclease HI [Patescibacteria group bacterium]|nr:ribonuclease HI [Patescibacteria group bacterium]MDE2172429.1 ribonuclease HI [Patescibacteria group bacterium]